MGRRRSSSPSPEGMQTMQLDALSDELEEIAAPPGGLGEAPPPLPPKRRSGLFLVLMGLVVIVMAALGIGAGMLLTGDEETPVEATAPTPEATVEAEAEEAPGEDEGDVVQLDEVVFDTDVEE